MTNPRDPEFVQELIKRRRELSISAARLSTLAGFSNSYISHVERGICVPNEKAKIRILQVLTKQSLMPVNQGVVFARNRLIGAAKNREKATGPVEAAHATIKLKACVVFAKNNGIQVTEIAKLSGFSRQTIYTTLREHNQYRRRNERQEASS